jgi:hypothetical protein
MVPWLIYYRRRHAPKDVKRHGLLYKTPISHIRVYNIHNSMSALTFQRLCVFILVLTGILLIASSVLKYFATQFFADTALIGQTFGLAWAVLLVFGLLAIYHFDIEQAGMIGFAAFVVAMIGTVLSVIPEYLLLSSLAGSSSATLELDIAAPVQTIGALTFLLGYLGFGSVIFYTGSLSKMGGLAFTLGMA